MICPYCNQPVDTKVCPYCGAVQQLPEQPAQERPQAPVNINVTFSAPDMPKFPGMSGMFAPVCPRCGSRDAYSRRRGFRWGLAIFGFFLIPVWGLLLGFIGSRKTIRYCPHCKKKF